MTVAETQYAVAVMVRGLKRPQGKVVLLPGEYVLHRSRPREALTSSAMSLDERALWLVMGDPRVTEVHFEDLNSLFTISKLDFWEKAQPVECGGDPGLLCVPLEAWVKMLPWYTTVYDPSQKEKIAHQAPPAREAVA